MPEESLVPEQGDVFVYVVQDGKASKRKIQTGQRAVGTVHSRTQEGLAVLATVGSTAPFVGLFGTVWGIYNALVRIGASGQASIDKVAGPVGEALIMTAIGLAVAVPAVLGYNWLVRRNKVAMDTVRAFGSDLHTVLLAGGKAAEAVTHAGTGAVLFEKAASLPPTKTSKNLVGRYQEPATHRQQPAAPIRMKQLL